MPFGKIARVPDTNTNVKEALLVADDGNHRLFTADKLRNAEFNADLCGKRCLFNEQFNEVTAVEVLD
jgi:hypothetical protein